MQTVKLKSKGSQVEYLQELLGKIGYDLPQTGYFGNQTEQAVRDFQEKNGLVVDGQVGIKTWTLLIAKSQPFTSIGDKFLGEKDLIEFANRHQLELASVKAVNEVESSGKGFLVDGRPKILFEGHIFWKELKNRGIDPTTLVRPDSADVLYPKWSKSHYKGGTGEYSRLEKAISISPDARVREAALASASWGTYQIMGFHFQKLGYTHIQEFVDLMQIHERNHLEAFGRYLQTFGCLEFLRRKDWASFARCYNGPAYAQNKYDLKLASAYQKHLNRQ